MPTTLRIRHKTGADTTFSIPDGSTVTIAPNGDVCICLPVDDASTDYEAASRIRFGTKSRYTVSASTTGYGKPPDVGGWADIFTNIHDSDPTDPEVRPLVRNALVTDTRDPNPNTTRCRKVEIQLELTQAEIERIQCHEHRNSFTFRPADSAAPKIGE